MHQPQRVKSSSAARFLSLALAGIAAIVVGRLADDPHSHAEPRGAGSDADGGVPTIGADVIVGQLPSFWKWGTVGTITAYSIGTTSCNVGDVPLDWVDDNNQHPVIAQNLYRLKGGRFEQIGMSWVKHGFCAEHHTGLCGTCQAPLGGCESQLEVGCNDPYDALVNGLQFYLGPRSGVNAATGAFPYPFSAPPSNGTIGRRLQVENGDLDPAANVGATYFAEGFYIHPDDAADGNDNNNASYRGSLVGPVSGGGFTLSMTGATVTQKPAIHAWKDADPEVTIVELDVPGDGRFTVGYRVTDNGDGTWHYEYAVMNFNSDRAASTFSIGRGAGATISAIGFKDINHHSGEPYSTEDWESTLASSSVNWSTQSHAANPNANALRWGTLYNFRFDAASPPVAMTATLGLFTPGSPDSITFEALGPAAVCASVADLDCSGAVDGADLGLLLGAWGTSGADLNGDELTDGADLGVMLGAWG